MLEILDRAVDKVAAIVGDPQPDARGQPFANLLDALLDEFERLVGVGPEPHDHDSGHHLATAIQVRRSSPRGGPDLYGRHVGYADRGPVWSGTDRNVPDVIDVLQVAQAADHVLPAAHLQHAGTDVDVMGRDCLRYPCDRYVERP